MTSCDITGFPVSGDDHDANVFGPTQITSEGNAQVLKENFCSITG